MGLSAQERRALLAASHRLRAAVTLAADDVSEAAVAHVRAAFSTRTLLKVRIAADSAAGCDAAAAELARRVPCQVVRRIGRVVLLYRESPGPAAGG